MSEPVKCCFREMEKIVIWLKGGKSYRGYFTSLRVDRNSIPKGFRAYDLRESDESDLWFCQLKSYVLVNHAGTFITDSKIEGADAGIEVEDYSFAMEEAK